MSEISIYQSESGAIEVRLDQDTVWLNQAQMAALFGRDQSVISRHVGNIFKEGELMRDGNMQKMHIAKSDKPVEFFNLDVIISVGYRVKSLQGTKFRQWATARLKEYIVKGFVMNDELLKNAGGGNYFEELLSRIRDIRSSEKIFWRKVLDIYATSIDYDPKAEQSILFFQTVQNKIHWAVHGNTAAEIVYQRADGSKSNMGLTHFIGSRPTKSESEIAKNYLSVEELELLNRIVTAYIEVAEIQAMNKTPMYMRDWIMRLDEFLKMTGKDILEHAGKISHQIAMEKAHSEYEKYKEMTKDELSKVEKDFIEYIDQTAIMVKKGKK
jgi:hypothetical protein